MVVRSIFVVSGGCEACKVEGDGASIVEGMTSGSEVSTSIMLVVWYIAVNWFKFVISKS